MRKIEHIEFSNVLENNKGSKLVVKIPSAIERITNIGLYISNPLKSNFATIDEALSSLFNAVEISVLFFNQNNTILDFQLISNQFVGYEKIDDSFGTGKNFRIVYNFSLKKIFIPTKIFNIRNTETTIIFKETDVLSRKRQLIPAYANWKPNVIIYLEHE